MYGNGNDNNDYNNLLNQTEQKKKYKKNKSSAPVAVSISVSIMIMILVVLILGLLGMYIYRQTVNSYELTIAGYDDLINEYKTELTNYEKDINALNNELIQLSEHLNELGSTVEKVSSENDLYRLDETKNTVNIVDAAETVSPSVIGIKVEVPVQNTNSFWRTEPVSSSGSGIILSEDGYIVTNYHVVSYAAEYQNAVITAILSDGKEYTAKYIGEDEINDLAVIKIEAENLPYAVLGSSEESRVGDFVIAIGNPLGADLYGSVTFGIISGLNRKIDAENVAEKLIQTDAAINPGNSGGALINLNGEVIGINTVKISKSDVEGLGFAIPIDFAKPIIESIINYGYVKGRPTIGLAGTEISNTISRIYGIPRGILIETANDSASAAGIKINDIVTKIGGQDVYSLNDIANIVKSCKVGETVIVTIFRSGEYYDLSVTLNEQT